MAFDTSAQDKATADIYAQHTAALRKRLLQDIAEIQQKPYPNIKYIPYDNDFTRACLILTPDGYAPLHLKVTFDSRYPLIAPVVSIQSRITHPNIFGDYICASILNTTEGWTSAYTLKGICIQLLSFFGSDKLEQSGGNYSVSLQDYKEKNELVHPYNDYHCQRCDFATVASEAWFAPGLPRPLPPGADAYTKPKSSPRRRGKPAKSEASSECDTSSIKHVNVTTASASSGVGLSNLPDELLALICSHLETEELGPFSRAWNHIGGENGIVSRFNIIRNRELICFTLKRDFQDLKLGVGVHVEWKGRIGSFISEFDLLSGLAFERHYVRRAVQGNSFEHWLPLPISRRHYSSISRLIEPRLKTLADAAKYPSSSNLEQVIYGFMSDIVVRLSQTAEKLSRPSRRTYTGESTNENTSTLAHASEKAIESYYHLFHLLICYATEVPLIVRRANKTIHAFLQGHTSKENVPNLGHLLIAVLISDADMTKDLLMAIIRETITRNVVWMLDKRGANMPELAYMEADEVSAYRLQKTFDASLTSYRLLMFQNTFRRAVNRGTGTPATGKSSNPISLIQLRDSLFDAHGAPPPGSAERLANSVRELQQVKNFPDFLKIMGLTPPTAKEFTSFLRRTLDDSVKAGYSVWGISQERAFRLRLKDDPDVILRGETVQRWRCTAYNEGNFFPNKSSLQDRGRQRGRGGRGRGER